MWSPLPLLFYQAYFTDSLHGLYFTVFAWFKARFLEPSYLFQKLTFSVGSLQVLFKCTCTPAHTLTLWPGISSMVWFLSRFHTVFLLWFECEMFSLIICLNTWSQVSGAMLEGCGNFRRQNVVGHWGLSFEVYRSVPLLVLSSIVTMDMMWAASRHFIPSTMPSHHDRLYLLSFLNISQWNIMRVHPY